MDSLIKTNDVSYVYLNSINPIKAVNKISLSIKQGEYIAMLGRNGSGKSTFARLLNALLLPSEGEVIVLSKNAANEDDLWFIRKRVGMIFQNPDNQIIGTTVEEDIAFGPENLGVIQQEIKSRVTQALTDVGILDLRERAPHMLSGGQKQKVGIAAILAMHPMCIIMDESTSMLDPLGREELLKVVSILNKKEKITIINITHHMEEATFANRVIIIDNGKIVEDGTPAEVFTDVDKITKIGLDVPQVTLLLHKLKKAGYLKKVDAITVKQAYERIVQILE
ncbi:MAG: energy-coupling factor transporter ATPase [Clostridiales bacterium]|nr:energy-coupling factor transporter ATPase [Clostridiales bacterium]